MSSNTGKKFPSMIWILVSFIPWIIYWLLSLRGSILGILMGLLISIIIFIYDYATKHENFMAAVALAYFIIAFIVTFILNKRVFIRGGIFLGNLTLLIMSFFSLILKYPYTYQISKRAYPKIYWSEPSFIRINMVITAVWSLIYLVNAVLSFSTHIFFKIIVPILLILLGMFISIYLPNKVTIYLMRIDIPRYGNWRINVDKDRRKDEDEFDVIIIGSGIGGLTAGALLSKNGFKVLVLEQYSNLGGYCQSFRRGSFIFDVGVESISGLGERGSVKYLLDMLNLKREDLFVKTYAEYISGNRRIRIKSFEGFKNTLIREFPEEKEKIELFFDEVKRVYEDIYRDTDKFGVPLPPKLIYQVFGARLLTNYHKDHPYHSKWMNKSFKEILDEFFENEELKNILSAITSYLGIPPEKASASMIATLFGYYIDGGYYPKGSSQQFANTLAKVIRDNNGIILLKHYVDKIIVENGAVKGVKVGEKTFRAPIIIYNGNVKNLFNLVEEKLFSEDFVKEIKELKPSVTAFAVYLGVDLDLKKYSPLIKDLNENISIFINSNLDSNLAPRGRSSVTILSLLPPSSYNEFNEKSGWKYRVKKWEFADKLIEKAEKTIPNLKDSIIIKDAATPKTFERCTLNWMGAIYAFDQSMDAPKRPYFKTPIRGLYLAGASTFPGAGIEAVVISGIICFHDILGWKS